MSAHTVILRGPASRGKAHQLVERAPEGWVLKVQRPTRSTDQNSKMWAMLTDVSRSMPQGRKLTPDDWKSVFMAALGYEVRFLMGLDGQPFPVGYRTSKLKKEQMSDLIEFIYAYGATHGVDWT